MGSMYKNTVEYGGDDRQTIARTQGAESEQDVAQENARLASLGQRAIVFPCQELIDLWRERISALALRQSMPN